MTVIDTTPIPVHISTADKNKLVWDAATSRMKNARHRIMNFQRRFPGRFEVGEIVQESDGPWLIVTCGSCNGDVPLCAITADALDYCSSMAELIYIDGSNAHNCSSCKTISNALIPPVDEDDERNVDWAFIALKRQLSNGEVDWLIPGVMERGKLAALFGPPKAGKSLLALQWAIETTERGVVLYLDKENDPEEVYERAQAMGHDLDGMDGLIYRSFMNWKADTPEGAAKIIELAKDEEADLIIFDSWAKFITGSQNDDAATLRAYELTVVPLRKAGVGILRIDHSGHGDVTRPYGSSQKLADVDHNWQIKAKQLGDKRAEVTLVHRDNRTARGEDTINLVREVNPLRHVARGQEAAQDAPEASSDDPVTALVELMDEKGWPADWPVKTLQAELRKIGQGRRTELVSAAARVRRQNAL